MTTTLWVTTLAWLLVTALGWIVTGFVDADRRSALRPAASLVGLAFVVVVLRWTSLWSGVRTGIGFLVVAAVVLAGLATMRDRRWWRASPRVLAWTLGVAAAAVIPAAVTVGPTHVVGDSRVVQPSLNNDAFYYVTLADWLSDHPATDIPPTTSDPTAIDLPPSWFPAREQLSRHVRIGQELVASSVSVISGEQPIDTWYPLTALWIWLMPTMGYAVAVALRMRRWFGLGLGIAASVAAATMLQLANQNSDALLGITLMPFAAVAVVAALSPRTPVPRWLAALLFTGAVGVYTEYLPVVGPALLIGFVLRGRSSLVTAVRRLPVLAAVAFLVNPMIWFDAVRSLIFIGGLPTSSYRSAYDNVGSGAVLNRVLGTGSIRMPFTPEAATPVIVALLGFGVVGALAFSRRRMVMLTLALWPVALAYYFVEIADHGGSYTQERVVGLYVPLLLVVATFGWDRTVTAVLSARDEQHVALLSQARVVAAALIGLAGLVAWSGVNLSTDRALDLSGVAKVRHVDSSFAQAASWVTTTGGPDGRDVDVVVTEFFDQLWITDALRDVRRVEYPSLYTSYQGVRSFWSGTTRRYMLVDRFTKLAADQALVVHSNARFELLDLSRGPSAALSTGDGGTWFVVSGRRSPPQVTLRGTTVHVRAPRGNGGSALPAGTLTTTTTSVTLTLPPGTGRSLNLLQNGLQFVPTQIIVAGT